MKSATLLALGLLGACASRPFGAEAVPPTQDPVDARTLVVRVDGEGAAMLRMGTTWVTLAVEGHSEREDAATTARVEQWRFLGDVADGRSQLSLELEVHPASGWFAHVEPVVSSLTRRGETRPHLALRSSSGERASLGTLRGPSLGGNPISSVGNAELALQVVRGARWNRVTGDLEGGGMRLLRGRPTEMRALTWEGLRSLAEDLQAMCPRGMLSSGTRATVRFTREAPGDYDVPAEAVWRVVTALRAAQIPCLRFDSIGLFSW